jgi:uncharacterized protein YdeI (BOF family)
MIDHSQSLFASFYAAFVNKFDAVEKALKLAKSRGAAVLDGANTELLISAYSGIIGNIKYTLQRNTYSMDENGNMVKSGIGLKPILEAFDAKLFGVEPSKAKRKADLAKFLIAKRIQQDLQNYTIPGVRDEAPKVDAETQAGQEGLTQNAINDLSIELQNKYDLSAAEVVVKEVDGNLFIELDGKITQDTLNDIYEFADQNNVDLKLHVNVDAFVDGKKIADGTIPGSDTFLNPKGEFVYGLQRSPIASTRAPELAGPTQPQPTVVQPDFAKDKKFVGPVTERRVSEEQALQARS